MSVDISSFGFEKTQDVLSYIKNNFDKDFMTSLHILCETIVAEARSNLQNNTNINTGDLLSSIRIIDEGDDYIIIGSDKEYAGYIEYGRGPVRPLKEGGWLHWIDKTTGKDVFAKFANAVEPSPFMEPAVVKHMIDFPDIYVTNTEKNISQV